MRAKDHNIVEKTRRGCYFNTRICKSYVSLPKFPVRTGFKVILFLTNSVLLLPLVEPCHGSISIETVSSSLQLGEKSQCFIKEKEN